MRRFRLPELGLAVGDRVGLFGLPDQALAGFVVERKAFAEAKAETTTETFVTLYAGLQ